MVATAQLRGARSWDGCPRNWRRVQNLYWSQPRATERIMAARAASCETLKTFQEARDAPRGRRPALGQRPAALRNAARARPQPPDRSRNHLPPHALSETGARANPPNWALFRVYSHRIRDSWHSAQPRLEGAYTLRRWRSGRNEIRAALRSRASAVTRQENGYGSVK